jgi:hypothetical protein
MVIVRAGSIKKIIYLLPQVMNHHCVNTWTFFYFLLDSWNCGTKEHKCSNIYTHFVFGLRWYRSIKVLLIFELWAVHLFSVLHNSICLSPSWCCGSGELFIVQVDKLIYELATSNALSVLFPSNLLKTKFRLSLFTWCSFFSYQ